MAFFGSQPGAPGAPGQARDTQSQYPPTGANRPGMDYRRQRRQGMQPPTGVPTPGTGWEPYGGAMPGQSPGQPPLTGTPTPGNGWQTMDPSQLPNGGKFGWASPVPAPRPTYPGGSVDPIDDSMGKWWDQNKPPGSTNPGKYPGGSIPAPRGLWGQPNQKAGQPGGQMPMSPTDYVNPVGL